MGKERLTAGALKQLNREEVYRFIYRQKVTSKQQIVESLHLGLSTVSQNLAVLEEQGRISRQGFFDSTGGRKAQTIRIVPTFRLSIGVGLFKKELQVASVDLYGQVLHRQSCALPFRDEAGYYQAASECILQFIEKHHYSQEQILGIAISVQGIVSRDGSRILYGAILENQHMKQELFAAHLPYPCHLEHDSKAAARLELWSHPALEGALVLLLNHNLGGALILHRQIYTGTSMYGGALEHICVDPQGPRCYCGQRGCLEMYCSADALEKAAGASLDAFFHRLRADCRQEEQQLWEKYLHNLACVLRNVILVADVPVIFSGYLATYLTEADLQKMEQIIQQTMPFPIPSPGLLLGNHGEFAATVGAALSYIDAFLSGSEKP